MLCVIGGHCSILYYQRYDSFLVLFLPSHHCVAFPCSRLAICKNADIIAFKGMKQHLLPDVLVHLHLGCKVGVLGLQNMQREEWKREKKDRIQKIVSSLDDTEEQTLTFRSKHWRLCLIKYIQRNTETHRGVWPVRVIEVEALVFFWLFGVHDC